VDGISLWLVLLTTLMVFLTLLSPQAMGPATRRAAGEFIVAMLVLENRHAGHLPGHRPVRLLRVLGVNADPDVLHHRHLGR